MTHSVDYVLKNAEFSSCGTNLHGMPVVLIKDRRVGPVRWHIIKKSERFFPKFYGSFHDSVVLTFYEGVRFPHFPVGPRILEALIIAAFPLWVPDPDCLSDTKKREDLMRSRRWVRG